MRSISAKDFSSLQNLVQVARRLSATDAAIISNDRISIEEDLAQLCRQPGCENFGLSASCPPHVAGPSAFRKKLENFLWAVVIRFDVPTQVLFSDERSEIFSLLHETVSEIERLAIQDGFVNSRAYAGGSCKKLFCQDHSDCAEVRERGTCRNPQRARESMSGFGINVSKLMQAAGWELNVVAQDSGANAEGTATVCGLILIG